MSWRRFAWTGLLVAGVVPASAVAERASPPPLPFERTEDREPCSDTNPLRNAFFGDIHVHTSFSQDASVRGTRNTPRDAYRFARGERLGIQPFDEHGDPYATVKLDRPLDFVAVTDHAELLGEVHICRTPGLPGYDSWTCKLARNAPNLAYFWMNSRVARANPIRFAFCGALGISCLQAALTPWTEIQLAAEAAYDRTAACSFTTFIGYEWTGSRASNNLHRNVIFRNDRTVELPISFYEESRPRGLWRELHTQCIDRGDGCDAIVIPHNSNLSSGLMFDSKNLDLSAFTAADAKARSELERLVEVVQHKGDSECRLGVDTQDELCGFEKLSFGNFAGRMLPFLGDVREPGSYVRNALKEGIKQHARLGVNPYKLGLIAGTDTHVGTPGAVDERRHVNHAGRGKVVLKNPPAGLQDDVEFNPGGLAGAWAEENSRDAIFSALHRREVFGTSGPRIPVRFFASFQPAWNPCDGDRFVERGYAEGVPMGADLTGAPATGSAPTFAVWAARDPGPPGRPGTPLQRIQIVKGWVDGDSVREAVYDVVGGAPGEARVDPLSCEQSGGGADALCGVWVDPDFDPRQFAFYYARVLENPSCRWSAYACNALGVDCSDESSADEDLFESCCGPDTPRTIQERAWASPIWYTPETAGRSASP